MYNLEAIIKRSTLVYYYPESLILRKCNRKKKDAV